MYRWIGLATMLVVAAFGVAPATASDRSPSSSSATDAAEAHSAAQLSPRVRKQLLKVHRLLRHGHRGKARRVGRRIRKRRVPLRRHNRSSCETINACRAAPAARARGCGTASGEAVYDIDVLGFDAFKPSIAQSFCWRRGNVTDLGGITLLSNLTTFGSVINVNYEGVIYSDAKWKRWHGKRHGERQLVRVLKFTGCTGIPEIGGCLFPKDWNVALALIMRGNGTFGFGSA
jgi:hypothetical protein